MLDRGAPRKESQAIKPSDTIKQIKNIVTQRSTLNSPTLVKN